MGAVPKLSQEALQDQARNKEAKKIFDVKQDQVIEFGRPDGIRYKVLNAVLEERYEAALKLLKEANETPSEFPDFHEKTERYFLHCTDLVYAIKAKRNFPGINSLTRAKQQELREKFKLHLRELQDALVRIERIEIQLKLKDIRSTVYVIRAIWIAGIVIMSAVFAKEITNSIASASLAVCSDYFDKILTALFKMMNI